MTIRVAFRYDDRRLFARVVCALRGGDSAHCEVSPRWDGQDHYCVSSSWLDGGVRGKWIILQPDKWRIYEVPGNPAEVEQWLKLHKGQRYDWPAFLGFLLLRRIKGLSRRWFCSEVAADQMWLRAPYRWDLYDLESACLWICKHQLGRRVQ